MSDLTETEVALERLDASNAQDASEFKGGFVAVPEGYELRSLEAFQSAPQSIATDHKFRTTKSLAAYLDRFQRPETIAFSNRVKAEIKAVIDHHDHETDAPSHGGHVARFCAQKTPQYQRWSGIHGKSMTQVAAGLFLEERAIDVKSPDPATIMDMVMQFDALKKVTFKQSTRLHDGQRQFQYLEENEARGNVTLPERIEIFVPVFEGQDPDVIPVRVKYRIEDGSLRFSFEIHDKELVEQIAFERCEDALQNDTDSLLILQSV